MYTTRIYSIYKHNNNKYFLLIIIIINFHIQTKNKREKKLYYVKLTRALHGLPTSIM